LAIVEPDGRYLAITTRTTLSWFTFDRCLSMTETSRRLVIPDKIHSPSPIVYVVDSDVAFRHVLSALFSSVGLQVQAFGSAHDFLRWRRPDGPSCLILDVRLTDLNGLDLQRQLTDAKIQIPIIFVTAYGDISMSVRAMKAGAIDFLTKPFRDQDVLDAIHLGLERDRVRRAREAEIGGLQRCFRSLTSRERAVVIMVSSGLQNKQIAAQLGVSENTIKAHRKRAMDKMQAQSLPALIKMIERLDSDRTLRDIA
jgi:RNA polymerase sigma factor (sigma-70 family)